MKPVLALLAIVSLQTVPPDLPGGNQPSIDVRLTQRHATVVCLDGKAVTDRRRWRLPPGPHTMSVTMRNEPRPGIASAAPGVATVTFTLEVGHRYEVEVRAPGDAFASRVFGQGEWTPVVRDRTADVIVSGNPDWQTPECKPRTGL